MQYFALFICYDGEEWYYPNPNEHKFDKDNPGSMQTWLRDMCARAIKERSSSTDERKFWALSPCRQPDEFNDVLGFLRNIESLLEHRINEELENYHNELARSDCGERPLAKLRIKLDTVEPFIGKSDKKPRGKTFPNPFKRSDMQTIFGQMHDADADPLGAGRKSKEFSWFCGIYAQGRTVRQ